MAKVWTKFSIGDHVKHADEKRLVGIITSWTDGGACLLLDEPQYWFYNGPTQFFVTHVLLKEAELDQWEKA